MVYWVIMSLCGKEYSGNCDSSKVCMGNKSSLDDETMEKIFRKSFGKFSFRSFIFFNLFHSDFLDFLSRPSLSYKLSIGYRDDSVTQQQYRALPESHARHHGFADRPGSILVARVFSDTCNLELRK